jgi:alpha-tubulin suppressor-like RCC1 family protein
MRARTLCAATAAASVALAACVWAAAGAQSRQSSLRAASVGATSSPARHHAARKHRARCRPGNVELALRGPRVVSPAQATPYVVSVRACGSRRATIKGIRLSLRGPQRLAWRIKRLRAGSVTHKKAKLTFGRPAANLASRPVVLIIEARSRRGRLLGRVRVLIHYRPEAPPPPPPLALGDTTVGWGKNAAGELGAGYKSPPVTSPVRGPLRGVREVAVAYKSGFALLNDGTVRAWGENDFGQLGDGTHYEKIKPVQVLGLSHVVQIAAAATHAMALRADGTVWTWGEDFAGQLGNGTRDRVEGMAHPIPAQVPGLGGVVAISAGGGDSVALLADGSVRAWGGNKWGQLGDGTKEMKLVPTPVMNLAGVRQVAMGGLSGYSVHMLALLGNGTLMVAGRNNHGELGLGDTTDRLVPVPLPGLGGVRAISASGTHSLALLSNGDVFSWGRGSEGELGYPAPETCETVPCSTRPRRVNVSGVSAVSAGWRFSMAISNEQVLSWGDNEDGALGNGTLVNHIAPQLVPGIAGVHSISAGEYFTLTTAEEGPSPDFTVSPVPGGLSAQWAPAPGSEPWSVSWRPFSKPRVEWGHPVILPPSARSYVITGLSQVLYEVRLKRLNSTFGYQIAYGVAG